MKKKINREKRNVSYQYCTEWIRLVSYFKHCKVSADINLWFYKFQNFFPNIYSLINFYY